MLVGRRDERTRFAALLNEVPTGRRSRPLPSRRYRAAADHMAVATSRVVLVHGLGGSGKSSLLQYFRQLADGSGNRHNRQRRTSLRRLPARRRAHARIRGQVRRNPRTEPSTRVAVHPAGRRRTGELGGVRRPDHRKPPGRACRPDPRSAVQERLPARNQATCHQANTTSSPTQPENWPGDWPRP